jgi:integrase
MNTLTTPFPHLRLLPALDRADLQPSTKVKYHRAWMRALAAGVDLSDPDAVANYTATLSTSGKLFFSAMMKLQLDDLEHKLKADIDPHAATPERIAKMQAVLWKMDALRNSIPTSQPKGEKTHIWLSGEQVEQITALPDRSTIRGLRDYIVLALLLGTGLRREELAGLAFDALKQQPTKHGLRDVLAVTGKGNKRRTIPISPKLAAHLREWHRLTGDAPEGRVVRAINKAEKINGSLSSIGIHNIVRRYGALIGLPGLDSHDLRRTYAMLGLNAGVSITQISVLLGHSSVTITQRYLNLKLDLEKTISDYIPLSGD